MIKTLHKTERNGAKRKDEIKNAVLEQLRNGVSAADISRETGELSATIRGWAMKERARIEAENATKRQFPTQNGETENVFTRNDQTVETHIENVSIVSATRATQPVPTATLADNFPDPFRFLATNNETVKTVEAKRNGALRRFWQNFQNEYVAKQGVLAFVNFVCIFAGMVSATYQAGFIGFLLGLVGGCIVLDCMQVLRTKGIEFLHKSKDNAKIFYAVEASFSVAHYFAMCKYYGIDPFPEVANDWPVLTSGIVFSAFVAGAFCVFSVWSLEQTAAKNREINF